jgi:thymidylate synthase
MRSYLDLVDTILTKGKVKENRTGVDAITIAHYHLEHDLATGFPLLTTKKMATKAMLVELEGFLRGITDKKWYKDRGCKIWNEWANPKRVRETLLLAKERYPGMSPDDPANVKITQLDEQDLGPIYGYQWRHFGAPYDYGQSLGTDQLRTILTNLIRNPQDRRMVCSAWSPGQIPEMALPPCHILWHVTVVGDTLNLCWFQRSCDTMLGIPFNVSSYAALALLLCKHSGLKPGKVSGFLSDVHIYVNHVEQAKEQISRTPTPLPILDITIDKPFDLEGKELVLWTHKDVQLRDYNPQPKIDFPIAV